MKKVLKKLATIVFLIMLVILVFSKVDQEVTLELDLAGETIVDFNRCVDSLTSIPNDKADSLMSLNIYDCDCRSSISNDNWNRYIIAQVRFRMRPARVDFFVVGQSSLTNYVIDIIYTTEEFAEYQKIFIPGMEVMIQGNDIYIGRGQIEVLREKVTDYQTLKFTTLYLWYFDKRIKLFTKKTVLMRSFLLM